SGGRTSYRRSAGRYTTLWGTTAACHSCALLPETSCEMFNRWLDRGLLIGDREDGSLGYFGDLVAM
ncbi:hypothetical protein, partial [Arthrobacter rhombi]